MKGISPRYRNNTFLSRYTYPLMMRACSSIKLPSPMTMGPASAMMRAFGWTTVLGPGTTSRQDNCSTANHSPARFQILSTNYRKAKSLPMVTSPLISLSTQTTAPAAIFTLNQVQHKKTLLKMLAHTASGGVCTSVLKECRYTTNGQPISV